MNADESSPLVGEAPPPRTWYFDERWHRTERVSVEARTQDEAWELIEAGRARFVNTVGVDECVAVEIVEW